MSTTSRALHLLAGLALCASFAAAEQPPTSGGNQARTMQTDSTTHHKSRSKHHRKHHRKHSTASKTATK